MSMKSTIVWILLAALASPCAVAKETEKTRSEVGLVKKTITKAIHFFKEHGKADSDPAQEQEDPDRQLRESLIRLENLASHTEDRVACMEANLDEALAVIKAYLPAKANRTSVSPTEGSKSRTPKQTNSPVPTTQTSHVGTPLKECNSVRPEALQRKAEMIKRVMQRAAQIRELAASLEADAKTMLESVPEDSENTKLAKDSRERHPEGAPR